MGVGWLPNVSLLKLDEVAFVSLVLILIVIVIYFGHRLGGEVYFNLVGVTPRARIFFTSQMVLLSSFLSPHRADFGWASRVGVPAGIEPEANRRILADLHKKSTAELGAERQSAREFIHAGEAALDQKVRLC